MIRKLRVSVPENVYVHARLHAVRTRTTLGEVVSQALATFLGVEPSPSVKEDINESIAAFLGPEPSRREPALPPSSPETLTPPDDEIAAILSGTSGGGT